MKKNDPRLSGLVLGFATCLAATGPALAQETAGQDGAAPACAAASAAQWLGGNAEASDGSTAEAPLSMSLSVAGNSPSVLAFRVSAADQPLRIEAQAEDGDPSIILMSETGEVLAENDDTSDSLNSRLDITLQPGAYCVSVSSVSSEDMPATVQVSRPDQPTLLVEGVDARLAACTAETEAQPLSADGPLDGETTYSVDTEGTETSYLRFTLAQPASLTLRAQSDDLDPFLRLFDAQGTVLGENDDADGTDSRLDFPTALPAGDYCIGVAALSPGSSPISVSAAPLDRDSFLRAAYRRGELLPPMDGSYPVEALDLSAAQPTVILHDGGAHWTRFDLDAETVVIVDAYGSIVGADPKLVLYAGTGQPVADNDDYNGSTNARLGPLLLQPGRYALAVLDVNRSEDAGGVVKPIGVMVQRFQRVE